MGKLHYVCKYTPVELLTALGAECENVDSMYEGTPNADSLAHPNLCGFGKTVIEEALGGRIRELVLVNCCDSIRSIYDVLAAWGKLDFLYMLDVLHSSGACSRERMAREMKKLAEAYGKYSGGAFSSERFFSCFSEGGAEAPAMNEGAAQAAASAENPAACASAGPDPAEPAPPGGAPAPQSADTAGEGAPAPPQGAKKSERYIALLGARMGSELFRLVSESMPLTSVNLSCVYNRSASACEAPRALADDFDALMDWYAGELLGQIPCMRMTDKSGRKRLINDPKLAGVIYHTVKFCDFYSFEYAELKNSLDVPLLKIESDYSLQSRGQLKTRLDAFAESLSAELGAEKEGIKRGEKSMGKGYFAGIDSGSASTDVAIIDRDAKLIAGVVLPTGAGASAGAERALSEALKEAGLSREDIDAVVTTGYGRSAIEDGDKSITEISCHAKGAHFLAPEVRTVIDIGGQDSKVICLEADGSVANFVMNDKCAAGTGRFLEMMARTLELSLDELGSAGLDYREDITISSMCTVFAESEVVSLIAQNKATDDIVHGLNKAVAQKTAALSKRVGGAEKYMMTGGVSKNRGLVKTLEEELGTKLLISEEAQLCGAIGAALFARELYG